MAVPPDQKKHQKHMMEQFWEEVTNGIILPIRTSNDKRLPCVLEGMTVSGFCHLNWMICWKHGSHQTRSELITYALDVNSLYINRPYSARATWICFLLG